MWDLDGELESRMVFFFVFLCQRLLMIPVADESFFGGGGNCWKGLLSFVALVRPSRAFASLSWNLRPLYLFRFYFACDALTAHTTGGAMEHG